MKIMKLLYIILLSYLGLINSLSFEEAREKIINAAYQYYEEVDKPVDESVKTYIKSEKFPTVLRGNGVFIKTISETDLNDNSYIPREISDQLKFLKFSDIPLPFHKVEVNSDSSKRDEHYYGVVMRDGKTIYYILFKVYALYSFTFKMDYSQETQCNTNVNGVKTCIKVPKYTPNGISEETYQKVQDYIKHQCLKKIKNHLEQIKELNSKILYTFNEGEIEKGEVQDYFVFGATISYDTDMNSVKLIIGDELDNYRKYTYRTEFGEDFEFSKDEDDVVTGYVTDDGYLNFMLRDGHINSKKLIYKKKLFNPSGVLPYKFIMTNDADLLVYDGNYKLLGYARNDFKDVDFAWPDGRYFYDKTGNIKFNIYQNHIYFTGLASTDQFTLCMTEKYKNLHGTGYLIVDKNGVLKHISYECKVVDWEIKVDTKGNGPYSFDIFNLGLVLVNGNGEVYWTTFDSVDETNEAYQEYIRKINN